MTATDHDHFMQFDQQILVDDDYAMHDLDPSFIEGFMDTTTCMSLSSTKSMMMSPTNSSHSNTTSGHHLTPKASAFKPIRRRSRVSKSTPITLLKANTSNFRALVQQFTGCPSTTAMSLAIHKGPITLNFQQGTNHQIQHHTRKTTTSMPMPQMSSNHVHQASKPQQHLMMREEESGYWLEHVKNNNLCVLTWGGCMDDDGFGFDDDFSLHELSVNAISSDIQGLLM